MLWYFLEWSIADFQVSGIRILVWNRFLFDGHSSHSTSTTTTYTTPASTPPSPPPTPPPPHPTDQNPRFWSVVRAREEEVGRGYSTINLSCAAPAILGGFPLALNLPQKCMSTGRREQSLSDLCHFRCLFLWLAALSTCTRRWKACLAPVYAKEACARTCQILIDSRAEAVDEKPLNKVRTK